MVMKYTVSNFFWKKQLNSRTVEDGEYMTFL